MNIFFYQINKNIYTMKKNRISIKELKEFYLQIPELIKKDENKWMVEVGLDKAVDRILKKNNWN